MDGGAPEGERRICSRPRKRCDLNERISMVRERGCDEEAGVGNRDERASCKLCKKSECVVSE